MGRDTSYSVKWIGTWFCGSLCRRTVPPASFILHLAKKEKQKTHQLLAVKSEFYVRIE